MRLVDLEPRWLIRDGRRVGFIFRSPVDAQWFQTCFVTPTQRRDQREVIWDCMADVEPEFGHAQFCNPETQWSVAGGIEGADFATLSVTPSLDGSKGGLWHGHITNGEIVGGI